MIGLNDDDDGFVVSSLWFGPLWALGSCSSLLRRSLIDLWTTQSQPGRPRPRSFVESISKNTRRPKTDDERILGSFELEKGTRESTPTF